MDENDLNVLVEGTIRYFGSSVDRAAAVGTPYLLTERGQALVSDYTGLIGVSGARRGCIYFTAPSAMLRHILLSHGETEIDGNYMADVVGEVANIISGNARRVFGHDFAISVPDVFSGRPAAGKLRLGERSFVIPINWRQYRAALVVSLAA
jgi:chemotaxis protein CheX